MSEYTGDAHGIVCVPHACKMDTDLAAVLPEDVETVVDGVIPPEPVDYDEGFVLPPHSVKPLQLINHHPLDTHLVFYEVEHIYTVDDIPTETSVTSLAHEFEKAFDPQQAIEGMKRSRSQAWPRLEYVVGAMPLVLHEWVAEMGILGACGGKTVAALPPHTMSGSTAEAAVGVLRRSARLMNSVDIDDLEFHTYVRAMTDAEIGNAWKANGQRASHMGTDRHYMAECFFNGLPHRHWEPDMHVLYTFCRTHMIPAGMVAYNTEKEIVCRDANVAGSIDLIVWDPSRGVHHIIDFKRSNKLRSQMRGYGKMKQPFNHLDDCKGAGYAIQTSIYQFILEREYGMRIGDRILLSLHAEEPFETSVPYMKEEVRYIMERRFARVRAQCAAMKANAADSAFTCSATGAPLLDAVELEDGNLVMEKVARVRGVPFVPRADVRAAFDAAVEGHLEKVHLDTTQCTSWRRLMPEGGIPVFQGGRL